MRERHWTKVKELVQRNFDQNSEEFTLDAIAEMQMHLFADEIGEISNAATMELAIELVCIVNNLVNLKGNNKFLINFFFSFRD